MKILCYSNPKNGTNQTLREKIKEIACRDRAEISFDQDDFCLKVEKANPTKTIVIICPANQREYDKILTRQNKLLNMFVILVQPDKKPVACLRQPFNYIPTDNNLFKFPEVKVSSI